MALPSVTETNAAGGTIVAPSGTNPHDLPGYNPATDPTSSAYSGAVSTPSVSSINSGNSSASSALTLPTSTVDTAAAGVTASTNPIVQATSDVNALNSGVTAAETSKNSILDYVKGLIGKESDLQTAQASSPEQAQVTAATKDLADINTQIANAKVAQRGEQDAITQRGDITQGGQQGLLSNVNYKYGRTLADLAIRQSAAQQNVKLYQDASDKALELQLAPIQNEISYYKDFAIANADNLTKSEQDKVAEIISEKNTIVTQQTADAKMRSDAVSEVLKSGNRIPDSVIQEINNAPGSQTNEILAKHGISLQANTFSAVTNPITGAQTLFNTKTGQFGASTGGFTPPGSSNSTTVSPQTNPEQFQNGVPITAQAANSMGGIYSAAWDIVNGLSAPSQTSFRGAAAQTALRSAQDRISQALFGHNFDSAASQSAYNFRQSDTYQKFTANAPVAVSTITQIADLAQKLNLQGVDALNSAKIGLTAGGLNPFASPDDRANAKALQSLLAVSADDIGLLLGAGSGSDYKTKLGGVIFDASGNVRTTQDLGATIQDRISSKLTDYYTKAGVTDAKQYAKLDTIKLSGGSTGGASTVTSNGNSYTVGQVYQDGSGAKWTVDANGKWTKQ